MKLEVKKVDELKRELKFEIPRERVTKVLDDVYKELSKTAHVKGFRKGMVPRNVLEAHHGHYAQEEAIRKILPEVYQEGIQKENLSPIDSPEIHDVNLKDGVITFTAKLDIKPDIKIKDYKGLKIKRKSSTVSEEDLQKTLDFIKKGQGEDKAVEINDAFVRGLGYPNLEEFKNTLRRQLELDKDRQNRIDVENQIVEALLKKTKVPVPQSLLKRQLERRVREALQHMKSHHGAKEEELKKRQEELRKELQESVEKDIKVYLVLDKIAQLEQIQAKEGENLPAKVIEFLLKEAEWEETK
ncbi:MAG TPA: trigger factor [Candidatus Omnitrophota bacterium]|nr:trigger factor [Candidatus Omnitrophota bacterium]